MSKWITGTDLLKNYKIQPIELLIEYIQKKGLQPYGQTGCTVSPADLMSIIFDENLSTADHSLDSFQREDYNENEDDIKTFQCQIPRSLTVEIRDTFALQALENVNWAKFELPESPSEATHLLTLLKLSLYNTDEIYKLFPAINKPSKKEKEHQQIDNAGISFIPLKKLSEMKSISIYTLRKYVKNEDMPYHLVGRKILVDPIAFDKWFLSKNTAAREDNKQSISEIADEVVNQFE